MRALLASILASLPSAAVADIEVVATLPDLAAIAAEVGGERVRVTSLATSTEDPHYVDARPNLMLPLNRADLLIVNGLDLEIGWLPALQVGARNGAIQTGAEGYLDASATVQRLEIPDAKIDRAMGDVHPGGNPHFAFDPRAGVRIARAVADRLAALDPAHREYYLANAERLVRELRAVARKERERFLALPPEKRKVVSYHRSMTYLLDWLQLEEIINVEPRPGIAPDPRHVARVLEIMRAEGAHVILQEEHYPQSTSRTLARLTGGRLVVIHTATRFSKGERYVEHIRHLAQSIYDALAG
jgi:zinc/manganese transport system substrate-binding protein